MGIAREQELNLHAVTRRVSRGTWLWLAGAAALVAGGTGVATAVDPRLGIVAFVAAVAVPATVLQPRVIAFLLVMTVFFGEALTLGGITPNRAMAPLAVLAMLVQLHIAPASMTGSSRTLRVVAAYGLLALASLAWTVSPEQTMYSLASLAIALAFMSVFALVIRTSRDLKLLLRVIAVSAVVLGLWWIASYLAGVDRFENRAGDPNYSAAYLVASIPLVLTLSSAARSARGAGMLYLAAAVIAVSVVATLSRGGILTLVVAALMMMVLPTPSLFRSRAQKTLFSLVGIVALIVMLSLAWADLSDRFSVEHGRQGLWLASLEGYRQHPVTGLGYGAFKAVSFDLLRTTPGADLREHLPTALREGREVHNAYLGALAELGLLGLVLFVGVLWVSFRALRRSAVTALAAGNEFVESTSNALCVGLAAFATASLFLSTETRTGLWMLVGLSMALPRIAASRPHLPGRA